jgi:hypothetical protein
MELSPGPKTRRKSAGAKWRRQADWQSSKPKHNGAKMSFKVAFKFTYTVFSHNVLSKGRFFSESMMHFSHCPKNVLKTILKKRF